jgi:hypothetical protein
MALVLSFGNINNDDIFCACNACDDEMATEAEAADVCADE